MRNPSTLLGIEPDPWQLRLEATYEESKRHIAAHLVDILIGFGSYL